MKAEPFESLRQSLVVHQSIHRDAGRCRNSELPGPGDALRDTPTQPIEATIALVLGHAVTVNRNQQAPESGGREWLDVLGQEPAIGDQPALDTGLRCRHHQLENMWMNEWLAALECHIADAAAAQDR